MTRNIYKILSCLEFVLLFSIYSYSALEVQPKRRIFFGKKIYTIFSSKCKQIVGKKEEEGQYDESLKCKYTNVFHLISFLFLIVTIVEFFVIHFVVSKLFKSKMLKAIKRKCNFFLKKKVT